MCVHSEKYFSNAIRKVAKPPRKLHIVFQCFATMSHSVLGFQNKKMTFRSTLNMYLFENNRKMRNDKENPIVDKSFQFSIEVVEFCDLLYENQKIVIGQQLLKSGTSIGANIREAQMWKANQILSTK